MDLNANDPWDQLAAAVNRVFAEPDPIDLFAQAVSRRKPRKQSDIVNRTARAIAEGKAELAAIHARRVEREKRNGPVARRAFDQWQKARAVYAETEVEFAPTLSPVVAMTMHVDLGEFRIW
jgi:hypothetical protein